MENQKPIAGRLKDYHVAGGWGGRGIVPGNGFALAYAKYAIDGNDSDLKIFEEMQPEIFGAKPDLDPF